MPNMFSPCAPCCKSIIVRYGTGFGEPVGSANLSGLVQMYRDTNCNVNIASDGDPTSLDGFKLIILGVANSFSSIFSPSSIAAWLATGGKRLLLAGIGKSGTGPGYAPNTLLNDYCDAAGVGVRMTNDGTYLRDPGSTCAPGTFTGSNYLQNGLIDWYHAASSIFNSPTFFTAPVENGTPLVLFGDSGVSTASAPGVSMAVERLASVNSEIVVLGDLYSLMLPAGTTPMITGIGCLMPDNYPFLLNLVELDVP